MGIVPIPEVPPNATANEAYALIFSVRTVAADFVELRTAVRFGNARAEKPDLAGLLQRLGHQALFVFFEIGDQRDDFLGDELRGRLADQALIVGHIRGRENVLGSDGRHQECRRRDSRTAKRLSSP